MEHRLFKKTGDEVSLLGFGAMRLPVDERGAIDEPTAQAMLDAALAGGVNYFDTAYGYLGGASEPFVGRALVGRHPRHSFFLASKLPLWLVKTREDALRIFDEQLARCQTDYFDFYLMHAVDEERFADTVERLDLYALLDEKRKAGQIRNLGFSFHDSPEVLRQVCDAHPWDFAQIQMNYLDWEMQDAAAQYRILEEHGIPCIVMEPVRGGVLANLGPDANALLRKASPNESIAAWALRWAAAHPNVLCVLSGMSTPAQVADNLATFSAFTPLSSGQQAVLAEALERFRTHSIVPCTACRYCMPCPSGVDIPGMIGLYNDTVFDGGNLQLKERYAKWSIFERAHNCVACRRCEKLCPQKLPIVQTMQKIDASAKA